MRLLIIKRGLIYCVKVLTGIFKLCTTTFTYILLVQKGVSVLPLAATSMARWAVVPVVAAVCPTQCRGCRVSPWLPVETLSP